MINNINVADCEFRGYCNICKLKSGSNCPTDCKDNPNCYYKQLKRAEQKLEKIKEYLCENVCLEGENCKFCDNHDCINIEVLKIIEE